MTPEQLREPKDGERVTATMEGIWRTTAAGPVLLVTDGSTGETDLVPVHPLMEWKLTPCRCTAENKDWSRCDLNEHGTDVQHAVALGAGLVMRWW